MKFFSKRTFVFSVLTFLFLFFSITGYSLAKHGNISWSLSYTLLLLGVCLAAAILICPVCRLLYSLVCRFLSDKIPHGHAHESRILSCSPRIVFLVSLALFFLAWLPCFLAYYPGICAYDTTIQLGYIARSAISEHHPVVHTLLLDAFTSLGTGLFHSATAGIALYTLSQMLTLAASFAGALGILQHFHCRRLWIFLLGSCGMFFPFHMYMSVSVTKDTFFTAFFLLTVMCLYGMLAEPAAGRLSRFDAGFLCSSILMILFRNNGIYAFAVLFGCLLLLLLFGRKCRRDYRKLFLLSASVLVAGYALLRILSACAGAVQGDRREMLSVPMQQLARAYNYHQDELSPPDREMILSCIPEEGLASYRPDIADPVKRTFNTSAILRSPKRFISTYVGLFFRYPGEYINAFLALNAGYLYPWDTSHAYINMAGGEAGLGYVQTRWLSDELASYGLEAHSLLPGFKNVLDGFASDNGYLAIPLLRYLFMPGIWLWGCLAAAAVLIYRRAYRLLLPFALLGGYYVTLVLGPTVQLRYVYPIMVILPCIIAFLGCVPSRKGLARHEG